MAVYYAIACALAWPWFALRDLHPQTWDALRFPGALKAWLPALGPALGAMLVLRLWRGRHPQRARLLGPEPVRASAFLAVPVVLGGIAAWAGGGMPAKAGWFAIVMGVYALLEEYGWRGFLHDALRPLPPLRRYGSIAVLWGLWHFTTFFTGAAQDIALQLAFMSAWWLAGSVALGLLVDRTGSVFTAAALHLGFNFATSLPLFPALGVILGSAVLWLALLWRWPMPRTR